MANRFAKYRIDATTAEAPATVEQPAAASNRFLKYAQPDQAEAAQSTESSADDGGRSFELVAERTPPPEASENGPGILDLVKRAASGIAQGADRLAQVAVPAYGAARGIQTLVNNRDEIVDAVTGESRTEYPDAPEFTPAYVESTKQLQPSVMGSAVSPDPQAQLDILKNKVPGLEMRQDKHGNIMLKAPGMETWAYLNKPGLSGRDLDEFGTQLLVTLPLSRLFGAGGSIPARIATGALGGGASSVTQDVAAMAQGSEQGIDPTRAAIATGVGAVAGPVLGRQPTPNPATAARNEAVEAANRQGITIPVGAASENIATRSTAAALKEIPVVGTPLVDASKKAAAGIEAKVGDVVSNLGSGSPLSAGHAVKDDLTQWMIHGSRDEADRLYEPVKKLLGKKTGTLVNTENEISTLVGRASAAGLEPPGIVNTVNKAANSARDMGGMTFEGMQTLRTEVGKRLSGEIVPEPGLDKGALKALYAALTADMGALAGRQGSKARVAWENATDVFNKDIAARRDALEKILGDTGSASPEAIVSTLRSMLGTGKGADFGRLLQVKRTLGQKSWDELASAIVADMGKTADGFSMARFRTAYEKLSTPGKHALFSKGHKQALDDLALISKKFAALERLGNPSGTARTGFIATSIPTAVVTAVMAPGTAALGAGGLVTSRILSHILARPATAKAMSKWANAYLWASSSRNRAAINALQQAERTFLNAMRQEGVDAASTDQQLPNAQ